MQDIEDKERYINTGRLIHILSNQMKRRNASEAVGDDGLTTMQKHVLKHILLVNDAQGSISERYRRRVSNPEVHSHRDFAAHRKKMDLFPGKVRKRMPD